MKLIILLVGIALSQFASADIVAGSFESKALGVKKSYRVFLPSNYGKDERRYPVIYLLHGWGVTESYWADNLGLGDAAKSIGLDAIVVMPDGDRSYYADSVSPANYEACLAEENPKRNKNEPRSDFCVRKMDYEQYITVDLIEQIDRNYRTIADRKARGISGESAGGFGAMQLAIRHKDLFSSVAVHSAFLSLLYDGPRPFSKGLVTNKSSIDPKGVNPDGLSTFGYGLGNWKAHDPISLVDTLRNGELSIYFDCGAQDEYGFGDEARYFDQRLSERGISHEYESVPGGHDDEFWKGRIRYSLQFHVNNFVKNGVYK